MFNISRKLRIDPKPERLNKMGLILAFLVFVSLLLVWEFLFAKELSNNESGYSEQSYSSSESDVWYGDKPDAIEQQSIEKQLLHAPDAIEQKPVKEPTEDKNALYREIFSQGIGVKFKLSSNADRLLGGSTFSADSSYKDEKLAISSLLSGDGVQDPLKNKLLENTENKINEYLDEQVMQPRSAYELKVGSVIPALLITSIDSDLPGEILGQVREDVFDSSSGKHLLVPKGTKLFGKYNSSIAYGQERLLVVWDRLIFPSGASLTLNGMPGVSPSGQAGFEADVNNHYLRVFGSAILMSVITSGVQLSQPQESRFGTGPSTQQTLAANLGQNIGEVSAEMTRRNLNIQPTLRQKYGYRFNVMVTKDIVFPGKYRS